ncbi:MAG: hypothetical protein IKU12_06680 [Oscillospiraceae bacterium]|nr:hypothetical protein [Oscillospiraceae bacterium]
MVSTTSSILTMLLALVVVGIIVAVIVVLCTRKKQPPQYPQNPPTQTVALCPNCGTPVTLGGGRWQCPKCGSGDVLLTPPMQ